MPNWCEGELKIRGKADNLKKFVLNGLIPVNCFGQKLEKLKVKNVSESLEKVESESNCWIEGTYRGFVEKFELWLDGLDDEYNNILFFNSLFAWDVNANELLEIAKKYNVDIKIFAFERGMQFNRDIEIVNGKIIKDDEIKYDDYAWECPCADLGG